MGLTHRVTAAPCPPHLLSPAVQGLLVCAPCTHFTLLPLTAGSGSVMLLGLKISGDRRWEAWSLPASGSGLGDREVSSTRSGELNSRKGFEGEQEAEAKQGQRGTRLSCYTRVFWEKGRARKVAQAGAVRMDGEFQVDCFQCTLGWVFGICPGVSCMLGGPSSMEVSEVLTEFTRTELRCQEA